MLYGLENETTLIQWDIQNYRLSYSTGVQSNNDCIMQNKISLLK